MISWLTVCSLFLKSAPRLLENATELRKEKSRKQADPPNTLPVIPGEENKMEIEEQLQGSKSVTVITPKVTVTEPAVGGNQTDHFVNKGRNGIQSRDESLDSDVAKEIRYLDEVLESNCCESVVENGSNTAAPCEPVSIAVDGHDPSVSVTSDSPVSAASNVITVVRKEPAFIHMEKADEVKSNGHSPSTRKVETSPELNNVAKEQQIDSSRRFSKDGEVAMITLKKEAKFELRAYHEDKKPSKLFDDDDGKETYKIKKTRASDEIAELERARQEVIRSQAVKKNPSIAAKWNPPQEKPMEAHLDPDKLESHKKYAERKQKKQDGGLSPVSPKHKHHVFVAPEPININREDIVTEQIDFSAARRQFLMMENTSQPSTQYMHKRPLTTKGVSIKPVVKMSEPPKKGRNVASVTVSESAPLQREAVQIEATEVTVVKACKVSFVPEEGQESGIERISVSPQSTPQKEEWDVGQRLRISPDQCITVNATHDTVSNRLVDDEGFTRVRAVLTVLNDDDDNDISDHYSTSVSIPVPPEELDSGLDDLSLRSQDTTVLETLSNDFSIDNISDSGASNETMNVSLDHSLGGSQEFSQPATPQAINPVDREHGFYADKEESTYKREGISKCSDNGLYGQPYSLALDSDQQLQYQAEIVVQNAIQLALAQENHTNNHTEDVSQNQPVLVEQRMDLNSACKAQAPASNQPQTAAPLQEHKNCTPKSPLQELPEHEEKSCFQLPEAAEQSSVTETNAVSQPSLYRPEFSPFSDNANYLQPPDYSKNNVFVSHPQEPEVIAQTGPFKLRSRKQKTLSMIEQEIRAAQEREDELRRQRQAVRTVQSPTKFNLPSGCASKTTPGKIEKLKSSPPSPTTEAPVTSPQPDPTPQELDGSGQTRSRGLMETLMEDFEMEKVKRREKRDQPNVLEATRVTRRKSAMALRWEAGIYANHEDQQ
eukprot:gi/632949556/ref/XP_007890221.1/ PREDICTED: A-kinase anchor protein 2-like isoform X2 [Callorhinchus milii]